MSCIYYLTTFKHYPIPDTFCIKFNIESYKNNSLQNVYQHINIILNSFRTEIRLTDKALNSTEQVVLKWKYIIQLSFKHNSIYILLEIRKFNCLLHMLYVSNELKLTYQNKKFTMLPQSTHGNKFHTVFYFGITASKRAERGESIIFTAKLSMQETNKLFKGFPNFTRYC